MNDRQSSVSDGAGTLELQEASVDTGLACLVALLRFLQVPCDAKQVRHRFGRTGQAFSAEDLLRAVHTMGLRARVVKSGWHRLDKVPKPCILERKDGKFLILGQYVKAEDCVIVQDPLSGAIVKIGREELAERWSGRLLLVTRRGGAFGRGTRFDISWFVPAMLRYKAHLIQVVSASFFLQIFALVSPLLFQVVIDKVLVHNGMSTLDVLVFALVTISIFEVVLGGVRTYVFSHTTSRIDVELGARLFRHLMMLPIAYFESRPAGQSVARVRELDKIRDFITGSALVLIVDLVFTFVFFAVMWVFSPMLTMIVLGSIPFYVIIAATVTPILHARIEEKFQRGAANQSFLVESITGVETLKSLAVEPQSQRQWEEQLSAYVHASFKTLNLGNVSGQAIQLISKLTAALTLYFGARAVANGDLTVGQLVAFNMLSARVSSPILRLAGLWNEFQQARISIERLGDILNTPTEPTYDLKRTMPENIKGAILFDHVSFRYRIDGPEVLHDLSLAIEPGEVVGIVGASGSGKSTLTKLVQRLYVPTSGRVMVDGIDLALVDTAWLRKQVGVVLQENILFNRSVRDNIALSDPGMAFERIRNVARLAGAEEFILELDYGYDSLIGERGCNLSGGQRQRIAIARALVTNPRILIMDEATSALDFESERKIRDNMETICAGRTTLIIAHRLGSVRNADRIIVLEKGRIVEIGDHDQLLRRGGRYARLHELSTGSA